MSAAFPFVAPEITEHFQGVLSNQPDECSDEVDGREQVARSLGATGGDGAELFEFGEEVFYQMASLVEVFVVIALVFAVSFGRKSPRFYLPWPRQRSASWTRRLGVSIKAPGRGLSVSAAPAWANVMIFIFQLHAFPFGSPCRAATQQASRRYGRHEQNLCPYPC